MFDEFYYIEEMINEIIQDPVEVTLDCYEILIEFNQLYVIDPLQDYINKVFSMENFI